MNYFFGIMIFPNGNKYIGGWKDGRWNGQGTFTSPDGFKYVGEWKNGGTWNGIYYDKDGWKYFGSWKNGEIWNGTEYDYYGNIIYRWVEGKRKYHSLNVKFR